MVLFSSMVRKKTIWNLLQTCFVIIAGIIIVAITGCENLKGNIAGIDKFTESYKFSIFEWETENLFSTNNRPADIATVQRYFSIASEVNSAATPDPAIETGLKQIEPSVEAAITNQIQAVLIDQRIMPSNDYFNFNVPPVYFRLTRAPYILATSPRSAISLQNQVLLKNDVTEQEIDTIEKQVGGLNLSVITEELGGYGAIYPTCVADNATLEYTIETAAHEWAHQYLAFKPLGFRYILDGLGIKKDYDAVIINETVADIIGKEIASDIIEQY